MSASSSARKTSPAEETPAAAEEGCKHHWVIEPPNGAVSRGHCKTCGADREFRNSFEYSSWYGSKSPTGGGPAAPK
jgi:hypothetical protein